MFEGDALSSFEIGSVRQFANVDGRDGDVALLNPIRITLGVIGRVGVGSPLPGELDAGDLSIVMGVQSVCVRERYVQKSSRRDGVGFRSILNDRSHIPSKPGKLGVGHAG